MENACGVSLHSVTTSTAKPWADSSRGWTAHRRSGSPVMSWTIPAQRQPARPRRKLVDDESKEAASWQQAPAGVWSGGSSQETWGQPDGHEESLLRPKKRLNSGSGSCSTLASQRSIPTSSRTDESAASHTSEPPSVCQLEATLEDQSLPGVKQTPVYHKNTHMPVDGWFQPCRYE